MASLADVGGTGNNTLTLLQQELAKAKERLNTVDDDIRKLGFEGRQGPGGRGRGRLASAGAPLNRSDGGQRRPSANSNARLGSAVSVPATSRRALQQRNDALSAKRMRHDNHEDDNAEEQEDDDVSDDGHDKVQSSIIVSRGAAADLSKTREEEIAKQQRDGEAQARHRRLFGVMLMGTLRKFKNEMESHNEIEKKRTEISQRQEEKERSERAERDAKSRELMTERQSELRKVRQMEAKIRMLSEFDDWVKSTTSLGCFIQTGHEPHIFWSPAKSSSATDALLARTRATIDEQIASKRREIEEDADFFLKPEVESKTETSGTVERRRGASRFLLPEDAESADLPEDEDEGNELVPVPGGTVIGPTPVISSSVARNGGGEDEEEEGDSPDTGNGYSSIAQAVESQESVTSATSTTPVESNLAACSNSNIPVATPVALMEQDSQQPKLPTPPVWTDENAQMGQFTPSAANDTINSSLNNGGGNTDMDVDEEEQHPSTVEGPSPVIEKPPAQSPIVPVASLEIANEKSTAIEEKRTVPDNAPVVKRATDRPSRDTKQQPPSQRRDNSERDDKRNDRDRDSRRPSTRGNGDNRNERQRSRERDFRRRDDVGNGNRSHSRTKSRSRSRSRSRPGGRSVPSTRYSSSSQRDRQPSRNPVKPGSLVDRPSARSPPSRPSVRSPPSRPSDRDRGRQRDNDTDNKRRRSPSTESSSSSSSDSSTSSSSSGSSSTTSSSSSSSSSS